MVWGGYFPTQHWDVVLRAEFVDFVVRGHGEMVFLQLLGELEQGGKNLATIPGLAYKDEAGQPVTNLMAPIPRPQQPHQFAPAE